MFFLVSDLRKMSNMYRFSLSSFLRLFQATLKESSSSSGEGEKRIEALQDRLLKKAYNYVSRSLFKTDRLAFAAHLARGMYPQHFGEGEWEAFLGLLVADGQGGEASAGDSVGAPSWVEEERRPAAGRLRSSFPALSQAARLDDGQLWSGFYSAEECEREFPVQARDKLKPFQRVLLVQALRPDRLVSATELFAAEALRMRGAEQLSPSAVALREVVRETSASEPVLVVVSPGSDPSEELRSLAAAMRVAAMHEVAMGQGQAEVAVEKLRQVSGFWVLLCFLTLKVTLSVFPFSVAFTVSLNLVLDSSLLSIKNERHHKLLYESVFNQLSPLFILGFL